MGPWGGRGARGDSNSLLLDGSLKRSPNWTLLEPSTHALWMFPSWIGVSKALAFRLVKVGWEGNKRGDLNLKRIGPNKPQEVAEEHPRNLRFCAAGRQHVLF